VLQNPNHIFLVGGQYNVTLEVTTDNGCVNVMTRTVVVYPKPIAAFTWTDECLYDVNQFVDGSTVAVGSQITGWNWDLGDNLGTASTQDT